MKKSVSLLLSILIPSLSMATTQDISADAYLLALNTVSPDIAQYTIQYKDAIESKCNTQLSVTQLKSPEFNNVVNALLFSDNAQTMNIDRNNALHDTMSIIGQNFKCDDLNAPFRALLNDSTYQVKHARLSTLFHNWNAVVSAHKG